MRGPRSVGRHHTFVFDEMHGTDVPNAKVLAARSQPPIAEVDDASYSAWIHTDGRA